MNIVALKALILQFLQLQYEFEFEEIWSHRREENVHKLFVKLLKEISASSGVELESFSF